MVPNFPETRTDKSLGHWVGIINFYTEHKDELTEKQVLELWKQSEMCRQEYNSHHNNRFNKCKENEVSTDLYPRAKKIKDKFRGSVTSSHCIAN